MMSSTILDAFMPKTRRRPTPFDGKQKQEPEQKPEQDSPPFPNLKKWKGWWSLAGAQIQKIVRK
jgi:hypothetical protein